MESWFDSGRDTFFNSSNIYPVIYNLKMSPILVNNWNFVVYLATFVVRKQPL
uniref:Uncharacterized protein n=1 Tax=Anguilla anguilla TaxID=7936 RepID=A0A0E9Q0E4_ANGAN